MKAEKREMNNYTYIKCFDICSEVKMKRAGKEIRKRDYPAAIVSCADSYNHFNNAVLERSGKVDSRSFQKTPSLEFALSSLGDIGGKRPVCKNYIGACAEPHAARSVMVDNPSVVIDDLVFSYAYRPRTKSVIRYCRNCTEIFNVQNP